jgi:hypothetical protein
MYGRVNQYIAGLVSPQGDMGAFEDFTAVVKRTDTMQALLSNLEKEPAKLLGAICREYEATDKSVPDHHLSLGGYFGEAMIRVLVSAELVTREAGDRLFLYSYKPTETGLRFYKAMLNEKKI